ncbi:MAG: lipoyl(octanoyl) transferase LipB [Pseudomonadota bacterium]
MQWRIEDALVDYAAAEAEMAARSAEMAAGRAEELVWLLEHPPLYTAGASADPSELREPERFPVHATRRGGRYTYHGPGQRVGYVMLNLAERRKDVRAYVWSLEEWVIRALSEFGVQGERRAGRVGVWVRRTDRNAPQREDKIAAIGVQMRRWISSHGVSINVEPDLSHYDGITPCGIAEHGVTSLVDLGVPATMTDVDAALLKWFEPVFAAFDAGAVGS